jgi:DNA-3-methyladenine glycosylase II
MTHRINTIEDVRQGIAWLAAHDPYLALAYRRFGEPPLRRRTPGLASLARIIIGQQVSVASAAAICLKFEAVFPQANASMLAHATDDDYRRAGLSRPKIATCRALAQAMLAGLNLEPDRGSERFLRSRLLAVHGIGLWTADLYELECLGLSDSWPAADLALQEAWRLLTNARTRPDHKMIETIAEPWRPWRAIAARLLWHSYRGLKSGEDQSDR